VSLGTRIREARTNQGITLQDMAERTGLSKSLLCQVENDKTSPSLQTLDKIAEALMIPAAYLLLQDEQRMQVVRAEQRSVYAFCQPGMQAELLSGAGSRSLKMFLLTIPPGCNTGNNCHLHQGEEHYLVLEGWVRAVEGDKTVDLKPGDSFHWNGYLRHRVENAGDTPAKLVVVTTADPQCLE
jgi:transcriptional regulator with XRE-family HTH domain